MAISVLSSRSKLMLWRSVSGPPSANAFHDADLLTLLIPRRAGRPSPFSSRSTCHSSKEGG